MSQTTAIQHQQSTQEYPETCHASYTESDITNVHSIVDWINDGQHHEPGYKNQRSQTKLSKAAKVNDSTLNTILRGKYVSSPTKFIKKMLDAIRRWDMREEEGVHDCAFVETSVYRTGIAACKRAHLYRSFAVLSAFVGTGKTRTLKYYAANNSNVVLIEATPDMNASVLVTELVQQTGAVVHKTNRYSAGTKAEKTAAIIQALKGTDSLLILDEAETVSTATLEYVRRISDKANIGVVLSGTEKLQPLIKDPQGRFGQISSRVCFWPPVIKGITQDDSNALATAALSDFDVELSEEVLDAFWQMCDGSARVLVSALIPGIKDYGLKKKKELTPELIFKVGQELLGFKKSRRI